MKHIVSTALVALLLLSATAAWAQIEDPEAGRKFNEGRTLFQQGQYEEALKLFLESARLEPNNYVAHYMLGATYNSLRQPDNALEQLEAAVRFNPNYYLAHFLMGRIYQSTKNDPAKAIEHYRKAGEISEEAEQPYWQAYFNLGAVLLQQQQLNEAQEAYGKAAQYNPGDERIFNTMGRIQKEQGRYDNALASFNRASQIRPAWFEPYFHMAEVLNKQGMHEEAVRLADQALERQPGHGGSLFEKGLALKSLERWDDAIRVLEQARRDGQWRQLADYHIDLIKNRDRYVIPPGSRSE